jgi:cell division protease FtsH
MDRKRLLKNPLVWILVAVLVYFLVSSLMDDNRGYSEVSTSQAMQQVSAGNVTEAEIKDREQELLLTLRSSIEVDGDSTDKVIAKFPGRVSGEIFNQLNDSDIRVDTEVTQDSILGQLLIYMIPLALLLLLLFWMMNNAQGGSRGVLNFGKSKAKQLTKDMPKTTFDDVAGADEAVEELHEIKDFLQHPARYQALGAKIPKGVLLYGPPGTGKTLLARAVAGEAGVPFFSISGSEFVEMFVGVGASRVRDLFEQAKRNSPCIVFVDEIDAVGRQRGAGLGGSHDEREQTLNQILVEMDGFDTNTNVIVVAATNRPDVLDPALLRPGRFDRQVVLDRPDIKGRNEILNVHVKGKPLEKGVDLHALAKRSPGFSGADLANLVNEAAILAARKNKKGIGMAEFNEAIDRVIAGPERRSRIITDEEKEIIAYHEGGHAVVQRILPKCDPVTKVTIVSRGMALGYTMSLPAEDRYLHSKSEFEDKIAGMLGGNVAERLVFADTTTGSSNDIEKATGLARAMVTQYGMSDKLGPLAFGKKEEMVFLGREISEQRNYSDEVASKIDAEVREIIDRAYARATEALTKHREILDKLADLLIENETIEAEEFEALFEGVLPPRSTPKRPRRAPEAPEAEEQPEEGGEEKARRRGPAPQPA